VSPKAVSVAALALFLAGSALAAPPTQDELKQQRDAKYKEAWVSNAPWVTDYAKARDDAKKAGKSILAYFSRSFAP
jgi:hypothetical protein